MTRIGLCALFTFVLTGTSPSVLVGQQVPTTVIDEFEQDLPPEAAELIREFNAESQQIRSKAEKEISQHRETAIIHELRRLQPADDLNQLGALAERRSQTRLRSRRRTLSV